MTFPAEPFIVNDPDDPDAVTAVIVTPGAWRARATAILATTGAVIVTAIVAVIPHGGTVTAATIGVDIPVTVGAVAVWYTTRPATGG